MCVWVRACVRAVCVCVCVCMHTRCSWYPFSYATDILTNSTPPIITLPPTNTEAIVGENITLECAATGHPTPSIFWERVFSRTFPRSDHVLSSGALSIGPVMVADAGRYRCIAENSEGMVQADAIITVKGMYIHGRVLGWEGAGVGGATNFVLLHGIFVCCKVLPWARFPIALLLIINLSSIYCCIW